MKNKNILRIVVLVLIVIFITGCPSGEQSDYATTNEEYAMGWILHNVDENTPTIIDYNEADLAKYTYYFNYPGDSPYTYANLLWWVEPGAWGAGASWMGIAVPSNRTFYVMGKNPVPENYGSDWSFSTSMYINYMGTEGEDNMGYDVAHQEHYESLRVFEGIKPVPGDEREIYFGTAPFRLTPITIKNNEIRLNDWPVKGYNGNSFLFRYTNVWVYYSDGREEKITLTPPHYQIYLNGELESEDDLIDTDYDSRAWDYGKLYYKLQSEGDYLVKLTIPTGYPVWENIEGNYRFTYPSDDLNMPNITYIDVSPKFEINKDLPINIEVVDDIGIGNVKIYYQTNGDWIELTTTSNNDIYNSNLKIIDETIEQINLKVYAEDLTGNSVEYIIKPISLKARNVNFNVVIENKIVGDDIIPILSETNIVKGDKILISGECIDDKGENCFGLKLDLSLNNEFIKSSYGTYITYQIPLDYNLDQAQFEVSFDGTGAYLSKKEEITIEIKSYDHDVGIMDIEVNEELKHGELTHIKTKLFNIGKSIEEDVKVKLFVDYKLIETKSIVSIGIDEIIDIDFEWVPDVIGWNNIKIVVESENDQNLDNNERGKQIRIIHDKPDLSGWIDWTESGYTANKINNVPITIRNRGYKKATGTKAKLYSFYNYGQIWLNQRSPSNILYLNDEVYDVSLNVENSKIKINIKYGNEEEIFEVSNYEVITLKDGTFVDVRIDYYFYEGSEVNEYDIRLIFAKEFNEISVVDVEDLEQDDEKHINIEWTPNNIGDYKLKIVVDTDEDVNLENNYDYSNINVKEDGPDLRARLNRDWSKDIIVNEENDIIISVENIGSQLATNNKIGLYYIYDMFGYTLNYDEEYELLYYEVAYHVTVTFIDNKVRISISYDNITEEFVLSAGEIINLQNGKLLGVTRINENDVRLRLSNGGKIYEKDISDLNVNQEFGETIKWIPEKKGKYTLYLFVKTDIDRWLKNNQDEMWIRVLIPGPDLTGWVYAENGEVNKINKIFGNIDNVGTEKADNVVVNVYDNGTLIDTITYDELGVYDNKYYEVDWTPTEAGEHNITVDIKADVDVNLENNKISIFVDIYNVIEANFKITNKDGLFVKRGLTISDYAYENGIQYVLDNERVISIPDYITNIMIMNASDLKEDSEIHEDMDYIFYTSFFNSLGQENMNVVSEQYGKRQFSNVILHFIYANKVNWQYDGSMFLYYSKDITNLNANVNNLRLYYCTDLDFENGNCNSEWLEADIDDIEYWGNSFVIMGSVFGEVKAEAFALGETIENRCNECGDGLLNLCDEEECMVLGDCFYESPRMCSNVPQEFQEQLRQEIDNMFSSSNALSSINEINSCLIVKVNNLRTHSYDLDSAKGEIFVSNSNNLECDGIENEDIIIVYNKFSGLQDLSEGDSCDVLKDTNMNKYQLWESRFIKPEFSINCTIEFEDKYCDFIKGCTTEAERTNIGCCLNNN